jgi:hypothetical protein
LFDGYALDVIPSDREAATLRRLRDGDRILASQNGRGFVWERSPAKLPRYLVDAVINKAWMSRPHPDGPLFGEITDGCLTLRGSHALRCYEAR